MAGSKGLKPEPPGENWTCGIWADAQSVRSQMREEPGGAGVSLLNLRDDQKTSVTGAQRRNDEIHFAGVLNDYMSWV